MASDQENSVESANDAQFGRALEELRPAMFALAYRITGSRADAEDIVQDAFLRLHRATPDEAIRSLKAYLATITTRLSLNRLRDQQAKRDTDDCRRKKADQCPDQTCGNMIVGRFAPKQFISGQHSARLVPTQTLSVRSALTVYRSM